MAEENEVGEQHFGRHVLRYDESGADYCVTSFTYDGDISGEEMQGVASQLQKFVGSRVWFSIMNVDRMGTHSPEAKKAIRGFPTGRGTAVVGATAQQKVVLSLINKAYGMLTRADSELGFCRTEDEAKAWIRERVERHLRGKR